MLEKLDHKENAHIKLYPDHIIKKIIVESFYLTLLFSMNHNIFLLYHVTWIFMRVREKNNFSVYNKIP